MGRLSLLLLGNPQVRHEDLALTFPTRKALALFIYLAVEKGTHAREKLMTLLWPESDDTHGRGSLRNTLGYLRAALHEGADEQTLESRQHRHLITERDTVSINFTSDCYLDLHILEAAFTQARTLSTTERLTGDARSHLLAQFQQAVDLYRGGFLEGFFLDDAPAFDDWVSFQRDVWYRRVNLLFDRLSQLQFESGEAISAIETATRWVALDPLNEAAYQRVMRIHFATGNREAALRAFDTCRTTLQRELQAEPTPTTKALAERIRAAAPRRRTLHADRARSLLPPRATLESPFVGRSTEYIKLVELYHRASSGQMQVVSLEGEAGIGKTRLAAEFLAWAEAQGADVLQARAFEVGGRIPYQSLVEALRRRLQREQAPDKLLSSVWLAELSRLLPELRERYPDLPSPVTDETVTHIRVFEAIVRLGEALSKQAPLLLFIDDVQWADDASLDVLQYVSRRWAESGTPVLLLIALRSEATMTTPRLVNWLSSSEQTLALTRLVLEPLTFHTTLLLVQSLASKQSHDALCASPDLSHPLHVERSIVAESASTDTPLERFSRWLFAETAGQPFFIMETLQALLAKGVLVSRAQRDSTWVIDFEAALSDKTWESADRSGRQGLLPARVREVIRTRLTQLSPSAFGLLAAGSVLGQDFSFEPLSQVAGVGENEGLSSLDEVLGSHLLHISKEKAGPRAEEVYNFTHEKIRDVVYTEAGEARRRIFHRRAFDLLLAEAAPPAQLAHHALSARLPEPTFHFSLIAGHDAMRLFALRDAIVHYEQAKLVLTDWQNEGDQSRNLSMADVQQLYIQLSRAYELCGDYHKAQDICDTLLSFARKRHEPAMETAALNRLALLSAWKSYDMVRAGTLLQEALRVAEGSGDSAGLAETEWNLAQMSFYTFQPQEARMHAERALAVARQMNLQDLIARSLNALAWANLRLGNLVETIMLAKQAQEQYVARGDRAMETDCLTLVALGQLYTGYLQEAMRAAQLAQQISLEIENAWGQMVSAFNLALGLRESGEYGEALAWASRGVSRARALGFVPNLTVNLLMLGLVQGTVLDMNASRITLLEAKALNENVQSSAYTEALATLLCMVAVLDLAWQEAYNYAQEARAARNYQWSYSWHFTLCYETEALLHGGTIVQAEEEVQRFSEYMKDNRRYRLAYLRALAVLAQWKNQTEQALLHLQEAVQLAYELGLLGESWHIQAALGELYQLQGNTEQACKAFSLAAEEIQLLASRIEDEQLRTLFLTACKNRIASPIIIPRIDKHQNLPYT